MSVIDIVSSNTYSSYPAKVGDEQPRLARRLVTGAQLLAAGVSTDTFKILKVRKGQLVREVQTIVLDADAQAITLDVGYIDDNGSSATAFETDAALNALGVTISADDSLVMSSDGFITITPSNTIESATKILVVALIEDYSNTLRDTTLAAAV